MRWARRSSTRYSANLLDFDDTHLDTIIHPAAPVAAPVLALAQARGFSGQAVLTAFILGVEVECRVGNAVSPRTLCAWLAHHLDLRRVRGSCGLRKTAGIAGGPDLECDRDRRQPVRRHRRNCSERRQECQRRQRGAKRPVCGLARGGRRFGVATGDRGPLGWARARATSDSGAIYRRSRPTWEIAKNTYKPYPAGIVFHAVIDACFHFRAKLNRRVDDIESITVQGSAPLLARGDRVVRNERDAGSAFIIARPSRCCWGSRRSRFAEATVSGPTSSPCARR